MSDINPNKCTALICGVSGQDGSYLAQLLLSKGYAVFSASRDAQSSSLCRSIDLDVGRADARKALKQLNWKAKTQGLNSLSKCINL